MLWWGPQLQALPEMKRAALHGGFIAHSWSHEGDCVQVAPSLALPLITAGWEPDPAWRDKRFRR